MVPLAPPQPPLLYVFAKARSPAKCLLRLICFNLPTLRREGEAKVKFPSACRERVLFLVLLLIDWRGAGQWAVRGIDFCPWSFPSLLVCTCLLFRRIFLKILAGHEPFRLSFSKNGVLNITIPTNIFFERAYSSLSTLDANWRGLKILSWIYLKIIEPAVLKSGLLIRAHLFESAFLVAQTVKNLPAVQETWVWSLGWEDPPEKEMATCSVILAWRIPWTEKPWWATVHEITKSWTQLSN